MITKYIYIYTTHIQDYICAQLRTYLQTSLHTVHSCKDILYNNSTRSCFMSQVGNLFPAGVARGNRRTSHGWAVPQRASNWLLLLASIFCTISLPTTLPYHIHIYKWWLAKETTPRTVYFWWHSTNLPTLCRRTGDPKDSFNPCGRGGLETHLRPWKFHRKKRGHPGSLFSRQPRPEQPINQPFRSKKSYPSSLFKLMNMISTEYCNAASNLFA